ncbi:MAG: hypothetical protein QOG05_2568 [Streptosporangiaceae bacterium]|nr:hypothetical protein [Streptosporangiaceae bacterium]
MTPRSTDAPLPHGDSPVNAQIPGGVRRGRLAVEAATAGLAFAALLGWASTALVGSFRGQDLPGRYWQPIPLRTDTSGFIAFLVAAVCLATSEYLRLRRRREAATGRPAGPAATLGRAVAETAAVLGTGLFVYLSFNAVTHPGSLPLHITHLLPWPAEGTVRVEALLLCACSAAVWRYLRARYSWVPGPVPAVPARDPAVPDHQSR